MMDTQSLFGKQEKKSPKGNQKVIACGDEFDDQPLLYGLKQGQNQLRFGNSNKRFEWISQGAVDIGFISSIDFTRLKGGWKVFPKICKTTTGNSRLVLFFNKNLSDINTIAVPVFSSTAPIVLQILLKELYQIDCKIIKSDLGLESALKKNDAVLLSGNNALKELSKKQNTSFIDLGEDWLDLTSLPLVYGFWIGNELSIDESDYKKLSDSLNSGYNSIDKIVANISNKLNQSFFEDYFSKTINYNFGDEEKAGLEQLYQYAFFYGFVEYIPDFNFLDI